MLWCPARQSAQNFSSEVKNDDNYEFSVKTSSKSFFTESEGFTVDNPPCPIFWQKGGGLSGRKCFVKVFLSKKNSDAWIRKKRRGGGYLQ